MGTRKASSQGILIKNATSLENMHKIDTIVFDKTGTITEGKPKVTDFISPLPKEEMLSIVASCEKMSEHPLAEAIVNFAKDQNLELKEVTEFEVVLRKGNSS